jgi:hypothetical protein
MPARFVEVANFADAARKSEAFSYLPWLTPNGTSLLLSQMNLWSLRNRSSSSSNLLRHSLGAATRADCPAAKLLLLLAAVLLVAYHVLVHVLARKALAQFGHSHCN